MLSGLLLHGSLYVGLLCIYSRWLDDTTIVDCCLLALLYEIIGILILGQFVSINDITSLCHLGSIQLPLLINSAPLLLGFDIISAYFAGLLCIALFICFALLSDYFEFDSRASSITLLSSVFAHAALLYFCAFDLFTISLLWELISIISFLLIQHWAARVGSYKAGLKVFAISQVGDVPFFGFIQLVLTWAQTTSVPEILQRLPLEKHSFFNMGNLVIPLTEVFAFLLSSAILLKSAQWFFYPWLLDAMEAPVPISAQLHSSTLVVIGFYLYFRFYILFEEAILCRKFLLCCGILTAIGASVLGASQIDGKRLLACSTASQLGYVLVALSLNMHREALALLTLCCANKALTFVWLGMIMRRHRGVSDFRNLCSLGSLAWTEHAGLLLAIANFTIWPGALVWHVKSLYIKGLPQDHINLEVIGLEFLEISWFFTTIYLVHLLVSMFYRPLSRSWSTRAQKSNLKSNIKQIGKQRDLLNLLAPGTTTTSLKGNELMNGTSNSRALPWLLGLALVVLTLPCSSYGIYLIDIHWASSLGGWKLSYY